MKLLRKLKRLAVRTVELPISVNPILGTGIDVTTLPEGHFTCQKCGKFLFECWLYGDNYRLELGCMRCNENYRLLFPVDCRMPSSLGRFSCRKHPKKGMILIHNSGVVCIGCESCESELRITVKTESGIITV